MYDPERYENNKSAPGQDIAEFVPQLIELMSWKDNEQILDYGCGAGSVCKKYFVPKAIQYNSKIDAVDISEAMIHYAKINNSHPLVQYHIGDIMASDFPLKEKFYDRIFSIHVLHFIKDFRSALNEFHKILKPGGQLGFIALDKSPVFEVMRILGQSSEWGPYMNGYEQFIPKWSEENKDAEELLRNGLIETGFVISEMRTEKRVREFEFQTWLDLLMSLNPFLKKIPDDLLPKLKNTYRQIVGQIRFNADELPNITPTTKVTGEYSVVFCLAAKPNN